MNVQITNKVTGAVLGSLNRADFQFLVDHMEEESSRDTDYFIDMATVEMLDQVGANPSLVVFLREAVGTSDGIDIAWEKI